jgi:hypothetical protein
MNLFIELRRHGKLAERRSPLYDKNRFAKTMMWVGALFWAGYLFFFGVVFAFGFDGNREPYDVMNGGGLIVVLLLDLLMRIPFQKTPTQEVKPYLLLPIRRARLMDFLLIRSGMSAFNLIWLFMFVPFALITIPKYFGFTGALTYCIGIWLLMLINNYWYLLWRTLTGVSLFWLVIPTLCYAAIALALFLPDKSPLLYFFMDLGQGFIDGSILTFAAVLLVLALLWWTDRCVVTHFVYAEVNKVEDTRVKHLSEYSFLDRYGEIGEYMRLELKLMLRNKVCKASLNTIIGVVIFFSLMLSFTPAYDSSFMTDFIVIYNFIVFGILFLSPLMSYEGNYIDGLMSRKETIYSLLRAKYILYSIACVIPLVLMIPAIVMGKVTFLTCFSWMTFTVGCIYFFLFQLAAYNDSTVNLTAKMTSRQTGGWRQMVASFIAFGLPMILNAILTPLIGEVTFAWLLIAVGALFIITSPRWLRYTYRRFMSRRYVNMEGFRNTRQH